MVSFLKALGVSVLVQAVSAVWWCTQHGRRNCSVDSCVAAESLESGKRVAAQGNALRRGGRPTRGGEQAAAPAPAAPVTAAGSQRRAPTAQCPRCKECYSASVIFSTHLEKCEGAPKSPRPRDRPTATPSRANPPVSARRAAVSDIAPRSSAAVAPPARNARGAGGAFGEGVFGVVAPDKDESKEASAAEPHVAKMRAIVKELGEAISPYRSWEDRTKEAGDSAHRDLLFGQKDLWRQFRDAAEMSEIPEFYLKKQELDGNIDALSTLGSAFENVGSQFDSDDDREVRRVTKQWIEVLKDSIEILKE